MHTCTLPTHTHFLYWQISRFILQCLHFNHIKKVSNVLFSKMDRNGNVSLSRLNMNSLMHSLCQNCLFVHVCFTMDSTSYAVHRCQCVQVSWDTNKSDMFQKSMHYLTPPHQQIFLTVCNSRPTYAYCIACTLTRTVSCMRRALGVHRFASWLCEKAKDRGWWAASHFSQSSQEGFVFMNINYLSVCLELTARSCCVETGHVCVSLLLCGLFLS